MRKHGLTVDNLLAVELVTAEGEQLRVDADSESELFWGLRGGGGNFGIATAFEFRLHQVGPIVLGGPIFWPIEEMPRVLRFLRDFAAEAPEALGITLSIAAAPQAPFLALERFGKPITGIVLAWAGDLDEGEKAIAPLRQVAPTVAQVVRPIPYVALHGMLDGGAPHGRHHYWKSHRFETFPDELIEIFAARADSVTAPFWQLNGWAVGGAAGRVDLAATAVGHREIGFDLNDVAAWPPSDPAADEHIAWVREGWQQMQPYAEGVYANFISDEGHAGVEAAYGERLARLVRSRTATTPRTSSD